jgi:phospholipid/cholesterol/gamma-HCH transport system substrate-binding protein
MQRKSLDVWVGLFVLLGAIAIMFLALKAGNMSSMSFGPSYALAARFDNIGGLKKQAPVKSAGVVVGRVQDIRFDDKSFQAQVILAMDTQFLFPKDSSLKILTSGLLGEQYIGIEPGALDKTLAAGDTITQTQSALVLETLISQFLFSKAADTASSSPSPAAGAAK